MQKADQLIRTKLRLPFTRSELVSRPQLEEPVALYGLLERIRDLNITLILVARGCSPTQNSNKPRFE
jgi:hypothetical protein